jgi:hypothetical protein
VPYVLRFSEPAAAVLRTLERGDSNDKAKLRKVRKALALLEQNPRYPGLHSHPYESFPVDKDVKVWDSYVENHTPSAWRIFWRYGPNEPGSELPVITVLAISSHP